MILHESWFKVITYYIFSEEKSDLQVLIILVKIVTDTLPRNPVKLHQRLIFLIIIFNCKKKHNKLYLNVTVVSI